MDSAHHIDELREQGYSIRRGAVPDQLCDELAAVIEGMDERWPRSLVQTFHGFQTVRYFDLLNADPVFRALPVLPDILEVVRGVLGRDCLLGTYGTVSIGPGERAQAVHADDVLYKLPRPHPDMYCNVMVALSDFTEANGATRLVPGSHRWSDDPEICFVEGDAVDDRFETIAAEMPRGSVCFFLGTTYHGGGANRTGQARHGMTMAYCAGWARPQENFLVAVSQERAATFDPELQGLMGYRTSRGGILGHIYTGPDHLSGPLAHRLVASAAPSPFEQAPQPAR
jgi:ectoine hydroxylase-related dioxygenase (phytanoyl-CoA dioxygenase family)